MSEEVGKIKKIYQILTGTTEEEYFTYDAPTFTEDYQNLKCTNLIIKLSKEKTITNKNIKVFYSSDKVEEQMFKLEDGVVIKSLDSSKILDWYDKNEIDADESLKDKELDMYRELLPQLLTKLNQIGGNQKNFFLE